MRNAASSDKALAALWRKIEARRAANMLLLAEELAETGSLRHELTKPEVADVLWATNAPELYLMLVEQRGWSPARFESWLSDAWMRLLLKEVAR